MPITVSRKKTKSVTITDPDGESFNVEIRTGLRHAQKARVVAAMAGNGSALVALLSRTDAAKVKVPPEGAADVEFDPPEPPADDAPGPSAAEREAELRDFADALRDAGEALLDVAAIGCAGWSGLAYQGGSEIRCPDDEADRRKLMSEVFEDVWVWEIAAHTLSENQLTAADLGN